MDIIKRLKTVIKVSNALYRHSINLVSGVPELTSEKDRKCAIIGLISFRFQDIKEKIIDKDENNEFNSKLYDGTLDNMLKKVLDRYPNLYFEGKKVDSPTLFSIIRNKFAHGAYIINELDNVEFEVEKQLIEIKFMELLELYSNMDFYYKKLLKKTSVERICIYNRQYSELDKLITTRKEAETFIDLFFNTVYTLKRIDGKEIPWEENLFFNNKISEYNLIMNQNGERKQCQSQLQEYYKKYKPEYVVDIKNKKIKDPEFREKVIEALLHATIPVDSVKDKKYILNQVYGDIILKMLDVRSDEEIAFASQLNLCILGKQYLTKVNMNNLYMGVLSHIPEMMGVLTLSRVNIEYSFMLDDILKKDNNYYYDRKGMFPFEKLDLSELKPSTLIIDKKGIEEINLKIKSLLRKKDELEATYEKNLKSYNSLVNREDNDLKIKKHLDRLKNVMPYQENLMNSFYEQYMDLTYKKYLIEKDYEDNKDYFYNLAIIEGIRNSIAHGNVEYTNLGLANEANELIVKFTNIYKGEVCFELETTLYNLECLFLESNSDVLNDFLQQIVNSEIMRTR